MKYLITLATLLSFPALASYMPNAISNPMTTLNDVIIGGASGLPTRLGIGGSGTVLTSNGVSTPPSWQTPAGGAAVNARYHSATSPGITNSLSLLTYTTVDFDTNSAYSSGTYTIPTTGKYRIVASFQISLTAAAPPDSCRIEVVKNGSTINSSLAFIATAQTNCYAQVNDLSSYTAGDTVQIQAAGQTTGSAIVGGATRNVFSIQLE